MWLVLWQLTTNLWQRAGQLKLPWGATVLADCCPCREKADCPCEACRHRRSREVFARAIAEHQTPGAGLICWKTKFFIILTKELINGWRTYLGSHFMATPITRRRHSDTNVQLQQMIMWELLNHTRSINLLLQSQASWAQLTNTRRTMVILGPGTQSLFALQGHPGRHPLGQMPSRFSRQMKPSYEQ